MPSLDSVEMQLSSYLSSSSSSSSRIHEVWALTHHQLNSYLKSNAVPLRQMWLKYMKTAVRYTFYR